MKKNNTIFFDFFRHFQQKFFLTIRIGFHDEV